jgi:hypothetical protein
LAQLAALFVDIAAVLDRADDAGVGTRPADAFRFELPDECRFRVPGRRLCGVAERFQLVQLQLFRFGQRRQSGLFIVEGFFGIVDSLNVGSQEAGEFDVSASGAELGIVRSDRDRVENELRVRHLAGHCPLPDQRVELRLLAGEAQFLGSFHGCAGRTNRLVSLLSSLRLIRKRPRRGTEIVVSVAALDAASGRVDRLARQRDTVGTHVSNVAFFVEPLSRLHRRPGRHADLPVRFLLQSARREGSVRLPCLVAGLDRSDGPVDLLDPVSQFVGLLAVEQYDISSRLQFAGVLIEVSSGRDAFSVDCVEGRVKFRSATGFQGGFQIPVFRADEPGPFFFPLDEDLDRDRLNPAGRQFRGHLLPEQRAQRVAEQAVQNAAGFLCLDEVLVQLAGIFESLKDCLLRDLAKNHPADGDFWLEQLDQMPADALALAVFVRRENEFCGLFQGGFELVDGFLFAFGDDVERLKFAVDVDSDAGPRLFFDSLGDFRRSVGEIPNVAHTGHHFVFAAEVAADFPRLGRRFHNDQGFVFCRHSTLPLFCFQLPHVCVESSTYSTLLFSLVTRISRRFERVRGLASRRK